MPPMHDAVGQYLRHTSWPIITAMVALMIFGITAIDVSEKAEATLSGDTAQQMVFGGVGLAAFVVMSVVPYRKIGQLAYPLFALTLISLVVVVLPILFPSVFGGGWIKSLLPPIRQAHRWIRLGGMQFQPSEVAKLTFIILLAWYLRSGDHYRRLGGLAIPFVLTLVPMTLILIEPDLGTSLLLLPTLYVMLFMAGAKLRHLVGIVAVGTVLVLLPMPLRLDPQAKWGELAGRRALAYSQFEAGGHEYVLCAAPLAIMEYRQLERIEAWWRQEDSEDERIVRDIGFQLQMSKMILGSGRWTGRGDWNRSETYFRILPDDHNDFIFAVIGGQWGLVGCVILLGLYAVIFLFGVEIAMITYDPFGRLLVVGVLSLLISQVVINLGVTIGLLPTTGMTLPLVSYGGSSLVINCAAIGLLVNVGQRRPILLSRRPFEYGPKREKPPAPYGPLADEGPIPAITAPARRRRHWFSRRQASGRPLTVNHSQEEPCRPGREVPTPFIPPGGGWPSGGVLELGDGYRTQVYHHHRTPGEPEHLGVLYLHGIQSHPGWFFASADHLGQCGYEVFQVTRRGSGANRIARGHARSAQQLLQDVEVAAEYVLSRTGADRMHLVGVSWGGKLAGSYAAWTQHRRRIASLTLIAPGIVPKVDVSPATKLGVAMCLLALGRKGFAIPLNEPQLFTDNEPMREFLRRDPLRLRRASARFLYASRCLDRLLTRAPEGVLRMPVTLIQATCDRIMDNEATAQVVMRLTGGRADVHELPGAHTLEFEPDPARFFDVLLAACRRRNS